MILMLKKRLWLFLRPIILKSPQLSCLLNKKYFGLNELDKKLVKYIDFDNGYFVELGANDGVTQSNTKHLELYRKWRGILIEPSPKQFYQLKKLRSKRNFFFNCACVSQDFPSATIELMYSNLMSITLEGQNDIPDRIAHAKSGEIHSDKEQVFRFHAQARTLQSIFVETSSPIMIDLLSLDVEGGELEVLNGIDFSATNFQFILIETRSIEEIRKFLLLRNYKEVEKLSHHDYLFAFDANHSLV